MCLLRRYEVQLSQGLECGGAYLKVLQATEGYDPKDLNSSTPYVVMFGPDKCGGTNKVRLVHGLCHLAGGRLQSLSGFALMVSRNPRSLFCLGCVVVVVVVLAGLCESYFCQPWLCRQILAACAFVVPRCAGALHPTAQEPCERSLGREARQRHARNQVWCVSLARYAGC